MGVAPGRVIAAAALGFLRTQGHDIVNERGEKILLRGVGLGNWMLPEGYMWKFGNQGDRPRRIEKMVSELTSSEYATRFWREFRANYITEADIRRIAELGFNSVRPALNARLFLTESDPPRRVDEGYQLLDNLVKWSKAHGVYVIIDMHGAPGGQTGQNIDDSSNDEPELFMQQKYQDQLVELWVELAQRYKDEPTVAGYDLLNEPLPERTGAAAKYKHLVEPLYQRITKAIRAVDPKHMIILEGVDWANDWSIFTERFDDNLVYQFHYYCWDTPVRLRSIDKYLDQRKRLNAPVWVGETGERDNTIYWATTDYFEANNIGWSFWPWKKMDTANTPYSIKRPQSWEAVAAYSRGEAKPAPAMAPQVFDEFLTNIRLANCDFRPDVVNAMLRRVPARIESENFGHAGAGVAYGVNEGTPQSKFYRIEEVVPIKVGEALRPHTDQFIVLSATEWTAYQIASDTPQAVTIVLRARVETDPGKAQLRVNEQTLEVVVSKATNHF
jgi:aryl-phospho-beta-D-glucosidase BglC (GH1 family)